MSVRRTYLDHNASSPLRPEAREAMLRVMEMHGNPSSIHAEGRALRSEIERARRSVARLVGAEARQVFFTSGATEAANWCVRGAMRTAHACLASEHECMLGAMHAANDNAAILPVGRAGRFDDAALADWLDRLNGDVALVGAQYANSETGVLQRVGDLSARMSEVGGEWVCDAVQAAGRVPVSFTEMRADFMLLSAHKLGGPTGVGALVVRDPEDPLQALMRGGGQERRQRAGTENAAGIAGFGAAAEAALRGLDDMPRIKRLRDRLEAGLGDLCAKWGATLHIFGQGAPRLPNTSCFAVEGHDAQTALMGLDLEGFAVSSGSACSSGKVGASHVLRAMGVDDEIARCALRVSLGWTNDDDDVPAFLAAFERTAGRALRRAA